MAQAGADADVRPRPLSDPLDAYELGAAAVYVFMDDHVRRAIGQMSWIGRGGENLPYYAAEGPDGKLVRRGLFRTGRPFLSALFRLAVKSAIIRHFSVNYPPRITDAHIEFVARMIAESRDEFKRKFASDAFYVLLFPEGDGFGSKEELISSRLIPMLRAKGIRILDLHALDLDEAVRGEIALPDGHPSPETYRIIAGRTAAILAKI
jgi:hypothetical protein